MFKRRTLIWLFSVVALALGRPAVAGGLTCSASDVAGDPLWQASTDQVEVPAFQDIVQIEAKKVGSGIFTFAMDVADGVPAAPVFPLPSVSEMIWAWHLDTDPATAPAGYPVAPGHTEVMEFVVRIIWDGGGFRGELIDRRPLLTGGSALVRSAPFKISKSTLSVSVDADALGNPSEFRLRGVTADWEANQEGNSGLSPLDIVPFTDCR